MDVAKKDVLQELVKAMYDRNKRAVTRDTRQNKARHKHSCDRPEIGRLVETVGYDLLMATLALDQTMFASEHPNMASLDVDTRSLMKQIIGEHVRRCGRCQLEKSDDRRWHGKFEDFLNTEKDLVKETLKDKRRLPRGKPRTLSARSIG